MSLRKLAVVYTIIVGSVLGFGVYMMTKEPVMELDMAAYNLMVQNVTKSLANGAPKEEVEHQYNCEIVFCSEEDYEIQVHKAMKQGSIVFDLVMEEELTGKVICAGNQEYLRNHWRQEQRFFIALVIGLLLAGYLLLMMVYYFYIRPFKRLEGFARTIAKGNYDIPLGIEKNDYFGAFTESFDLMRSQLLEAKEHEIEANKSKKELVASLSHDIKTPVAVIKATCEVIHIKEASNQDVQEKISIIEAKAETIDRLVGNMFHATLEELEYLRVEPQEVSSTVILDMLNNYVAIKQVKVLTDIPACLVKMDELRLEQVLDNMIGNSQKYANTDIEISFQEQDEGILVQIRDFGPGVNPEELPMVTEKFYRGSNGAGVPGSGLGLYLAKYFMLSMGGDLMCYNDNGFVVELFVSKVGV